MLPESVHIHFFYSSIYTVWEKEVTKQIIYNLLALSSYSLPLSIGKDQGLFYTDSSTREFKNKCSV